MLVLGGILECSPNNTLTNPDPSLRIQTPPYESRPLPIVGLMVEKSHPQVIGLDRGNPGFLGHTNGSLGTYPLLGFV